MKIIILPIGSTEQHGPHLPLGTDSIIAQKISQALAEQLETDLAPALKYGVSIEHADFPGTISIPPETLLKTVKDICKSLHEYYQKIIIINTHGGNTQTLRDLNNEKIVLVDLFQFLRKILDDVRETEIGGICHACEIETSLMLHLEPHLVKKEKITSKLVKYVPELDPQSKKKPPKEWKTINYSHSGILGDPTKATPEKGEKIFHTLIQQITKQLKQQYQLKK